MCARGRAGGLGKEQSADAADADRGWHDAGDDHLGQMRRVPKRSGADPLMRGEHRVDQRQIAQLAIDRDIEPRLAVDRVGAAPVATSAVAIPASVPSTMRGKTLFVPVEIGIRGTSRQPLATIRLVPSPPRVTMRPPQDRPALGGLQRIARVAEHRHRQRFQ